MPTILPFKVLRALHFGSRHKDHRRVPRKTAQHDNVTILHRYRNHQIRRHDRQIDLVGHQRHRRDRTRCTNDFGIDSFFTKKAGFLRHVWNRMGHGPCSIADAQLVRPGLRERVIAKRHYGHSHS